MNPSPLLYLLLTLFLFLFCHAMAAPEATPEATSETTSEPTSKAASEPTSGSIQDKMLYQIVCKDAMQDNDRCLKLLETHPRITKAKNYLELCKQILKMAIKKATKGHNHFNKVLRKQYPSSSAIKECATFFYGELVDSFKSALGELIESPDTANYDAKVAGDGPTDCETALADENILNPFLSKLNNDMWFLSFVAFLATNYLPHDQ